MGNFTDHRGQALLYMYKHSFSFFWFFGNFMCDCACLFDQAARTRGKKRKHKQADRSLCGCVWGSVVGGTGKEYHLWVR